MASAEQMVRVIALGQALATARRGVVLRRFAEERGWPIRYVHRDLRTLERAGFPIQGEQGRYRLVPDRTAPAHRHRRRRRLALFIARQLAGGLRGTSLARALDRLWTKLGTDDHGTHHRAGRALHGRRPGVPVLHRLVPSSPRGARLRRSSLSRAEADRRGDRARAETRSRVALRRAFRIWRSDSVEKVRLHFTPAAATEIAERRWHASQQLEPTVSGGLILTMELAELAELERWLLGFGPDVAVIEPRWLADRVRDVHAAAAVTGSARERSRRAESRTHIRDQRREHR